MSLFNWNGIRFPGFTMQQLNLDWILTEIKRVMGFFPEDGNAGEVLMKTEEGTEWEPLEAVDLNINALPEDTELTDTDKLVFYDISASANRKITAPNLLNSMMSNGSPLMDGTASAGTSKKPARYDHRHPTDTSRQAALSGAQMNAVNSGAPSGAFNNGKLKLSAGGTDAETAAGARQNIETIKYVQDVQNTTQNAVICTLTIPANGSRTITFNSDGFCEGLIFATGALSSLRETVAFGSTASGEISYSVEYEGTSRLTISVVGRAMTITSTASATAYLFIINVEGNVASVT